MRGGRPATSRCDRLNAAGWGWFVDPTPGNDSEFTTPGDPGEQGRMDLLTVLAHELGLLLGYEHEADGLMIETLATGIRQAPLTENALQGGMACPVDWYAVAAVLALDADLRHKR